MALLPVFAFSALVVTSPSADATVARAVVDSRAVPATAVPAVAVAAAAAPTRPGPVVQEPPGAVSADALPTVQIDGVVWAQAISGNTVYAGGSFANARPAGAAPKTHLTPRHNLLSYNLTTGALNTTFAPNLNGQVRAVAVTPDGTKVIVGGDFTTADGVAHARLAAYSTATGRLLSTFNPRVDSTVIAIVASNTTVWFGGGFHTVDGVSRATLAAVTLATGALTGWHPTTDYAVRAMVFTPDHLMIIVGGSFQVANGRRAAGLVALGAANGATHAWAAGNHVVDQGRNAGITSLTSDGAAIYGTGYAFKAGSQGNLEGAFAASPNTGVIKWVENCHGDTYGSYSDGRTVYTVSHAHYCVPVGGYPQSPDEGTNTRRTLAFTANATGALGHDEFAGAVYHDWAGWPSPSLINWFPDFTAGTFTGQSQAAWSIAGNKKYVALGGEFPTVNGAAQQGLVRFAVRTAAARQPPMVSGSALALFALSYDTSTTRVAWQADWDRDNLGLRYELIRDGNTRAPISTRTVLSTFWNRPTIVWTDSSLAPGSSHTYQVRVTDSSGNSVLSATTSAVVRTTAAPSPYQRAVLGSGASSFWRFESTTDTRSAKDFAGFNNLTTTGTITPTPGGPLASDQTSSTASTYRFDGSTAFAVTKAQVVGPTTFSEEAWFSTTTTAGGKIIGFGNSTTGTSTRYDRHIYLNPNGTATFGMAGSGVLVKINSPTALNDGKWHQVVGTLAGTWMAFFVDGHLVGTATVRPATVYAGFWQVGGDRAWAGALHLDALIADVSIYPTVINSIQILQHYNAAVTRQSQSTPGVARTPAPAPTPAVAGKATAPSTQATAVTTTPAVAAVTGEPSGRSATDDPSTTQSETPTAGP